jgi:hypothetical protein
VGAGDCFAFRLLAADDGNYLFVDGVTLVE